MLFFPITNDILSVASQLNHLISWMGRTVKVQCHKPSGTELQSFGVKGIFGSLPPEERQVENLYGNADQTLHVQGVSVQGHLCPGGGALSGWSLSKKGSLSRGVSAWGSLSGGSLLGRPHCTVTRWRYASYWNAFL